MVCAINPSLDLHTDSSELLQLQQVSTLTWKFFMLLIFFFSPSYHFICILSKSPFDNLSLFHRVWTTQQGADGLQRIGDISKRLLAIRSTLGTK